MTSRTASASLSGLALLASAICAVSATAVSAQSVALKYNWTQGDELTYRTTVRTTSSVTGGSGDAREFQQTLGQTMKITVAAVAADGTATLREVIQSVTLDLDGAGGKLSYDSAKPPAAGADPRLQSMAKTMGAMVGEPISVTIAANGAIRRIDGNTRIIDKLMADLPRDPMAGGLAQNIRAMLGDEALRAALEQSFSRMPDGPVTIGDTWTSQQSVGADASGKIVGTSTFTLKAIEGTGDAAVARIAVALALKQQDVPSAGASFVMKLGSGSGEGELLFQIARGRIQRNGMRTDIASSAVMRGPDGGSANMQNKTRTEMTMELIQYRRSE